MNYIQQLQKENEALKSQLSDVQNDLNTFLLYLHGPKFAGPVNDWISVNEVRNWVLEVRLKTLID